MLGIRCARGAPTTAVKGLNEGLRGEGASVNPLRLKRVAAAQIETRAFQRPRQARCK